MRNQGFGAHRLVAAASISVGAVVFISIFVFHSPNLGALAGIKGIQSGPTPTQTCVIPVPADAAFTPGTRHGGIRGSNVTYPNGTTLFYPENLCPQPAPLWTENTIYGGFNAYQLASAAEENPKFLTAENGSSFILDPTGFTVGYSKQTGTYDATVYFDHYGDQTYYPCGSANVGLFHVVLGQIMVTFHKPMTSNGTWDLSDPQLEHQFSLNEWSCPASN